MFIVLTDTKRPVGRKIRFHVHNIVKYLGYETENSEKFTQVHSISGSWDAVAETPEEIDKLLMESYVSVKDLSRPVSK